MRVSLFFLLAFFFCGFTAMAQTKKSSPSPETKAVEAAVVRFFAGMRQGDSAVVRSVLAENVRLVTVAKTKDDHTSLRETPMQKFVEMVAQPQPQVLDERIYNLTVQLDGDLATLWCDYAFYVGTTFSHCGVNAFQLYKGKDGWKIFHIADTRRKENCDLKATQPTKTK